MILSANLKFLLFKSFHVLFGSVHLVDFLKMNNILSDTLIFFDNFDTYLTYFFFILLNDIWQYFDKGVD